jgi:hypothetical protein
MDASLLLPLDDVTTSLRTLIGLAAAVLALGAIYWVDAGPGPAMPLRKAPRVSASSGAVEPAAKVGVIEWCSRRARRQA